MSQSDWNHLESYKQSIIDGKAIADIWSVDDVLSEHKLSHHKSPLTEDDAKQILEITQQRMDANDGINWIVIDSHIDNYIRTRKENKNA